jgi:hypothetical protein
VNFARATTIKTTNWSYVNPKTSNKSTICQTKELDVSATLPTLQTGNHIVVAKIQGS